MSASRNSSFSHSSSLSEITATSVMNNSSVISVPEGCVTIQLFPLAKKDLIPGEVENIFILLLTGICLPLLFVVSFFTNIINMVVFYKHGLQERINACLFTLSLMDLLSISVTFGYCSDVAYMYIIGKTGQIGPSAQFFSRHFLTGLHGFLFASQMVYTVVALERCLCVTRPLLAKSFMSTKTTVVVLVVLVVITMGECVFTVGVQYRVLCLFDPKDSSVFYISYPRDFYFRNMLILNLIYTVDGFVFLSFPFVCVTVCTIVTAIKLKKLSQWRETMSSASDSVSSRDLALTRCIIGTSMLFIVCNISSIVIRFSPFVVPGLQVGGRYKASGRVLRIAYQLSTAINNTFNFFVYYSYGSKFRETTHNLFSFCYGYRSKSDKTKRLAI